LEHPLTLIQNLQGAFKYASALQISKGRLMRVIGLKKYQKIG
jgi:hypothetical protein